MDTMQASLDHKMDMVNHAMSAGGKLRFALYGAGMVAEYHHRAIAANRENNVELGTIVHHDEARFDEISRKFGVPCMTEEEALDRSDIHVICICTPSGLHADQAIRAARAGKHVMVEKPVALTLSDADGMIQAAEDEGVKLGVLLQRRSEPQFRTIRRAIESGDLGHLTVGNLVMPYFRGQEYFDAAPWRGTWHLDGGGVLMNQGIHMVDLLVWFMGDPVGITAQAGTLHRSIEVEDVVGAVLSFENGSVATLAATTTARPGFSHRLEVYGTNGGVQVEGESIIRWDLANDTPAAVRSPAIEKPESAGSGADPRGIAVTGHIRLIGDFIDAIREDRTPLIDGREGRRSLAAVLGMYESAGLRNGADVAPADSDIR